MKFRDSGMPPEELWTTFFNPEDIISKMEIDQGIGTLLDVGCGYGTFLFPLSKILNSKIIGIDIDDEMINICRDKIKNDNTLNIEFINGDISTDNTIKALDKYKGKIDYVTLFNILHCEEPTKLLKDVYNILNKSGRIGIIHWKYEKTPRGPSMDIRPTPEKIINWASDTGFTLINQCELQPYHYGLVFVKK